MRNAGDRTPGGSAGRRHRSRPPEQPAPSGGTGGASLFTPAYRVSRAPAGTQPAGHDTADSGSPAPATSGYGSGDRPGPGYSWPESVQDEAGTGYRRPAWSDDPLSADYGWSDDAQAADAWPGSAAPGRETAVQPRGNAVRGFPPAPGEPLPVYPPGPFAAWNRGQSGRAGERNGEGSGSRAGGYAGPSRQLAIATITPDEFDTDYSLPAIKDPVPGTASGGAVDRSDQRPAKPGRGPARGTVTEQPRPSRRGGPAGGRRRAARTRRRRVSAVLAITAAGAIIAAVALILVLTSPGGGAPAAGRNPTNTPGPARTSATPPPGKWKYIGSRKTDAVPLSLIELYPAVIASAGTAYTRTTEEKGKNCHGSLIGSALQTAVRRGGCTQELRATYLSKAAKAMATIGVFNLKTSALASKAAAKAGRSEFVAQLPAKTGQTKSIGQGTGLEEALVKGHYLVLVWAEATNLAAPPKTKSGRARFSAFMTLLVNNTVNLSLSIRMVDGRPPKRH